MTPTLAIRSMRTSDLPEVLAIQAACYTEVAPESLESIEAKLVACPSTCFVASLDRSIVGYLVALTWEFSSPPELNASTCQVPSSPNCLYLHDLAVSPSARNAGAGRALVQRFFESLRTSGLERASLIAVQDSAPYWERYGFRIVSPSAALREKLSAYGEDAAYMQCPSY